MIFGLSSINAAVAIIPALVLLVIVYREDKLEKEPSGLLITLIVWGIISTFLAIAMETVGENLMTNTMGEVDIYTFGIIEYFFVVGFSEEFSKFICLKHRTWKHKAFNCQFDAVVYAMFLSLGFAVFENLGYVAMYGFETGIIRAVTAVPGHACFGAIMGIYYGRAKAEAVEGRNGKAAHYRRLAVLVPMIVHGGYDFLATIDSDLAILFTPYVIIMYIVVIVKIKRNVKNDHYFVEPQSQDINYILFNNNRPPQ